MLINYRYNLGIKVDNTSIPDPSEWNYQVGDLDTDGGRDATRKAAPSGDVRRWTRPR